METRKNETEILTDSIGMDNFEHMPNTSAQALQTAQAGQSALAAALPPGELQNYPGQRALVSKQEQRRFMLEHTIATDPHWILDRAEDGSIDIEMMDILRKYYPQMHADIGNRLREQAEFATTYQQRLMISALTGDPTTPDTEPMARAILSQPAPVQGEQGQQRPGATAARPHSSRSLQGHTLSSASGSLTSIQKTALDQGEK